MELKDDQIKEKYGKEYGHCSRNTLLPYEYEFTSVLCGYNVFNRKNEVSKSSKKLYQSIKLCYT